MHFPIRQLGRSLSFGLAAHVLKCGGRDVTQSYDACACAWWTYFSPSRCPAGLLDLPHHCSHQEQRQKTTGTQERKCQRWLSPKHQSGKWPNVKKWVKRRQQKRLKKKRNKKKNNTAETKLFGVFKRIKLCAVSTCKTSLTIHKRTLGTVHVQRRFTHFSTIETVACDTTDTCLLQQKPHEWYRNGPTG